MLVVCSLVSGATSAWAQPSPIDKSYARVAVGASGNIGYAEGNSVPAAVDDVVILPSGFLLKGLHLMPRWRGGEQWSAGLLGGLAMHTTRDSGSTNWWDLEAEARLYPAGARALEFWLAGSAGAVLAVDRVPRHTVFDGNGTVHPAHTYNTVAPCGSLGVGFDKAIAPFLAIGLELRTVVFGFNSAPSASAPTYQVHVGGTLGVTVTALAARTPVR